MRATIHWHQLHLLFRHIVLPNARDNQRPFPHHVDHDARECIFHAHLVLHRRALRETPNPPCWGFTHDHLPVHRRNYWNCHTSRAGPWRKPSGGPGGDRIHLPQHRSVRIHVGPCRMGRCRGNFPSPHSFSGRWYVHCLKLVCYSPGSAFFFYLLTRHPQVLELHHRCHHSLLRLR